jgi:hypothetical protein
MAGRWLGHSRPMTSADAGRLPLQAGQGVAVGSAGTGAAGAR